MQNFRIFGSPPYQIILLHGGPGAAGYLSPLAHKLSARFSLIEAFQTRDTILGLIDEVHDIISEHAQKPVITVGHSWGAWLSLLYGSRFPAEVKKHILVSSPPFNEKFTENILQTRMKRLDNKKSDSLNDYFNQIENSPVEHKDKTFLKIASILREADSFELNEPEPEEVSFSLRQYDAIWSEANRLRSSGELIRQISQISCPVLAIHGDHDPHPAEGVKSILKQILKDFRFELLAKCGHEPWSEKFAKGAFFKLLMEEIQSGILQEISS